MSLREISAMAEAAEGDELAPAWRPGQKIPDLEALDGGLSCASTQDGAGGDDALSLDCDNDEAAPPLAPPALCRHQTGDSLGEEELPAECPHFCRPAEIVCPYPYQPLIYVAVPMPIIAVEIPAALASSEAHWENQVDCLPEAFQAWESRSGQYEQMPAALASSEAHWETQVDRFPEGLQAWKSPSGQYKQIPAALACSEANWETPVDCLPEGLQAWESPSGQYKQIPAALASSAAHWETQVDSFPEGLQVWESPSGQYKQHPWEIPAALDSPEARGEDQLDDRAEGLYAWESPSGQSTQVVWKLEAKRFRGSDKTAVSPPFKLQVPGQDEPAGIRLSLTPKATSTGRGGSSFRSSGGIGTLKVKSETETEFAISYRFSFGKAHDGQQWSGPFDHNFASSSQSSLPQGHEDLNFNEAVDEPSQTFYLHVKMSCIMWGARHNCNNCEDDEVRFGTSEPWQ